MASKADKWRKGSKRNLIATHAESGKTKRETFDSLKPLVESQEMIFAANVSGKRVPKPIAEQLIELKFEIGRVYKLIGKSKTADFEDDSTSEEDAAAETEIPEESEEESEEETNEEDASEEESEEDSKPIAKGKKRIKDELAYFLRRVREIREFCNRRAELSEPIDAISMRPAQAASVLIPAGVPADALLHSMTLHWPKDARQDAGISDFDVAAFSRKIMLDRGIPFGQFHELFGYAMILAECRVPIMLVGPAGTGKSHLAKQISAYQELSYGETPMSPGATRGDLLGRHTVGGFIPSEFCETYGKGGVFNFEEIDASDPSMLIVLNNALAGDELYNSANGESYDKANDFIPVSTANTFGLGATREFTARERLDAATIDRWRMGRIYVAIDESVEENILYSRI